MGLQDPLFVKRKIKELTEEMANQAAQAAAAHVAEGEAQEYLRAAREESSGLLQALQKAQSESKAMQESLREARHDTREQEDALKKTQKEMKALHKASAAAAGLDIKTLR